MRRPQVEIFVGEEKDEEQKGGQIFENLNWNLARRKKRSSDSQPEARLKRLLKGTAK